MPECDICGYESSTRGVNIHKSHAHDISSNSKKEYTCDNCGDTFEEYESRRGGRNGRDSPENDYCSRECASVPTVEKVERSCSWCGDTVQRYESALDEMGDYELRNTFCDKDCESEWKQSEWVGEDHPKWIDNTVEMSCDECGCDIEVNEYYVDKQQHFFCDKSCYDSFQISQSHVDCAFCGDEFEMTERQRHSLLNGSDVVCSKSCYSSLLSDEYSGDGNPAWRGGKERYYGPSWPDVRSNVIERDGEKCICCDTTRLAHYKEFGQDLEVHHKTPLRTFDGDYERANDPENLATLCKGCHTVVEHTPQTVAELSE